MARGCRLRPEVQSRDDRRKILEAEKQLQREKKLWWQKCNALFWQCLCLLAVVCTFLRSLWLCWGMGSSVFLLDGLWLPYAAVLGLLSIWLSFLLLPHSLLRGHVNLAALFVIWLSGILFAYSLEVPDCLNVCGEWMLWPPFESLVPVPRPSESFELFF